jgi:hypothetical protein
VSIENNKSLVENFKPQNCVACNKKDETMSKITNVKMQ